jgi:hypothetical protein
MSALQSSEKLITTLESWPYNFLWDSSDSTNFKALAEGDFDAINSGNNWRQNIMLISDILEKLFESSGSKSIYGQMRRALYSKTHDRPDRTNIRINYDDETLRLVHAIIVHVHRFERGLASINIKKSLGTNPEAKWTDYSDFLVNAISEDDSSISKIFVPINSNPDWLDFRHIDVIHEHIENSKEEMAIDEIKKILQLLKNWIPKQKPNIREYYAQNYDGFDVCIKQYKSHEHESHSQDIVIDCEPSSVLIELARLNAGITESLQNGKRYTKKEKSVLKLKCYSIYPTGGKSKKLLSARKDVLDRIGFL